MRSYIKDELDYAYNYKDEIGNYLNTTVLNFLFSQEIVEIKQMGFLVSLVTTGYYLINFNRII